MAWRRWRVASSSLAAVGLAIALGACDGDPEPVDGGPDAGGADDGGPLADGGSGTDAGPGADGGPGADAGVDAGLPSPRMEARVDRPLVERDNEQLTELTVTCIPRDEAGLRLADPGDLDAEVTAVSSGAEAPTATSAFTFTFPTRGTYRVSCRSASLGLEGSETVEVAFEGIDRQVVRLAAAAAAMSDVVDRGIDAARAGDEAAVRAAGTELAGVAAEVDPAVYAARVELLAPFDWPTEAEARAAGLEGGADDAAWAAGIAEAAAASAALRAALAAIPTTGELSPGDDAGYVAASARLAAAARALDGLTPSAAALLASRPALDALVAEEIPTALRAGADTFASIFGTATVTASSGSGLTLIGALINIGIQHVVSTYSYGALVKQVGRAVLQAMLTLLIAELIDELLPPDAGAPEIDLACQASCSILTPGNPWTISGTLWTDPDASQYRVIFIPPNAAGLALDVADLFASARDVLDGDHWIQIAKNIKDIIDSIRSVAATAYGIADSSRVVLQPSSISTGDPDFVEMPALPTRVNCGTLAIPQPGVFIPVRVDVGRGPSFTTNIGGETGC